MAIWGNRANNEQAGGERGPSSGPRSEPGGTFRQVSPHHLIVLFCDLHDLNEILCTRSLILLQTETELVSGRRRVNETDSNGHVTTSKRWWKQTVLVRVHINRMKSV